jgi:hypothetical protein
MFLYFLSALNTKTLSNNLKHVYLSQNSKATTEYNSIESIVPLISSQQNHTSDKEVVLFFCIKITLWK